MISKEKISTHSPFQPLQSVVIGETVTDNFFDWIKQDKIKKPLQRIIEETNEDLQNLEKICKQFGARVFRPLKSKCHFVEDNITVSAPSLQVRDFYLTLGNKCYYNGACPTDILENIVQSENFLQEYNKHNRIIPMFNGVSGANCYKLGSRIIIPHSPDTELQNFVKKMFEQLGYEVVITKEPGHTDGCMSVLKPGVILSITNFLNYNDTFPGWDVLYLKDESWNKISKWTDFKNSSKGRWWVPGEEDNEYLINFVNTWLNDWVGYISETVFDVNVLSLSEEYVILQNYNKEVFDYLKKHKIEPIICPLRHRYFWDGGLHCVSLDLQRKGEKENYF